jgi:hypothetical protein
MKARWTTTSAPSKASRNASVADVAAAVFDLAPTVLGRVERTPRDTATRAMRSSDWSRGISPSPSVRVGPVTATIRRGLDAGMRPCYPVRGGATSGPRDAIEDVASLARRGQIRGDPYLRAPSAPSPERESHRDQFAAELTRCWLDQTDVGAVAWGRGRRGRERSPRQAPTQPARPGATPRAVVGVVAP